MSKRELDGVGRGWGRLLSTGKVAASAVRLAGSQLVRATPGQQEKLGELLAVELDQMKGMAMKLGQILSYMDGALPEDAQAALRKLQAGTRSVSFDVMREVLESGLGGKLDALFDEFQVEPIASASIGQVYRARFEGQPVAVKLQYPGIRDTIASDFARLEGFSRIASLASSVDGPAVVAELRERFEEECDYRAEATWQDWFHHQFSTEPHLHIPRAVLPRCAETVLTSEWVAGEDFYSFTARASDAERQQAARTLLAFALRSLFQLRTIQADPHPGNYLFPQDRAGDAQLVAFLDFGCVRRLDQDFIDAERRVFEVVVNDRRSDFREAALATGMLPKPKKFDFDHYWRHMRYQYAPYCTGQFEFTPEYIRAGSEFSGPKNPNLRLIAFPPQWVWVQRLLWGLNSVLTRLGARGNFAELAREIVLEPRLSR